MLNDYIDPAQTFIACPNQDVVYGLGFFSLDEEPVIIQVPEFGERSGSMRSTMRAQDTHTALGVDLVNGPRGMYMAMKPIAEINGVQDVIEHIGQRFAGQGRRKKASDTISLESSSL